MMKAKDSSRFDIFEVKTLKIVERTRKINCKNAEAKAFDSALTTPNFNVLDDAESGSHFVSLIHPQCYI